MSQDKIDIKDVTPKTFNPKTHKGKGDRFNPSNRIYVRESKGVFQKLRRYGGWFLLSPIRPDGRHGFHLVNAKRSCSILVINSLTSFGTTLYPQDLTLLALLVHDCRVRPVLHHHLLRPSLVWLPVPANRVDLHVHLV